MNKIELQPERCVRYYSKLSTCDKCELVCPTNAILIEDMKLKISMESCVECGACNSICPNEAFLLEKYSPTAHFFSFLKEDDKLLSCKKDIPCLAALSVEHLVSFVTQKGDMVADIGHCTNCEIGSLITTINQNIDEANFMLEKLKINHKISKMSVGYEPIEDKKTENPSSDRRDFFKRFGLKGAIKTKVEFETISENLESEYKSIELQNNSIKGIRENSLSDRRKIFFTALKGVKKPEQFEYINEADVRFFSNKNVDESCTNCSICYRICPTGALSTDVNQTRIDFDMLSCVRCNLCHDVCEPDAISLVSIYTKDIFQPISKELITFDIRRCDECANFFTYKGGELMCDSCKSIEDDAKSLWGIK